MILVILFPTYKAPHYTFGYQSQIIFGGLAFVGVFLLDHLVKWELFVFNNLHLSVSLTDYSTGLGKSLESLHLAWSFLSLIQMWKAVTITRGGNQRRRCNCSLRMATIFWLQFKK